ncbi:hypothetical protein CC86DRAFT_390060 [Ophiobolus disseminans]|uniref:BTB domain-containing protein n=1 Tax=Ophiobolus disseminans TaxID=1469910 RepID=A0A6A7AL25_9PLEO|nr:hypothetical protein CC86DRAFT_390060 [Ophiobolus disseminans]
MASSNESASKTRGPALGSALVAGTVILDVGPDHVNFCIHKALLEHYSEYFRNALKGPWAEAQKGVIWLGDIDIVPGMRMCSFERHHLTMTVNIFVHWLYTQQLPAESNYQEWLNIIGESYVYSSQDMIKAYAFADRFLIPSFQRAINETIVDYIQSCPISMEICDIPDLVKEAYKSIPSDRPMIQCLVDCHCSHWRNCCAEFRSISGLPYAFEQYTGRSKERLSRCYYEHADDVEATTCGKLHIRYDAEKYFGMFGEEVVCIENCGGVSKCRCEDSHSE